MVARGPGDHESQHPPASTCRGSAADRRVPHTSPSAPKQSWAPSPGRPPSTPPGWPCRARKARGGCLVRQPRPPCAGGEGDAGADVEDSGLRGHLAEGTSGRRKSRADSGAQKGRVRAAPGPPGPGRRQKCRKGAGGSPGTAPSTHSTTRFPCKPAAPTDPWVGATVTLGARNWPRGSGAELLGCRRLPRGRAAASHAPATPPPGTGEGTGCAPPSAGLGGATGWERRPPGQVRGPVCTCEQ